MDTKGGKGQWGSLRDGGIYTSDVPVCSVTSVGPTLCNPMDSSLPVSSVHEILQASILEWVAMPSSRGSP